MTTILFSSCSDDDSPEQGGEIPDVSITVQGGTNNGSDLGLLSGSVTFLIGADVADAIQKVDIKVDDFSYGTLTAAPFSFPFDTEMTNDATHTLFATTTFTNGKTTASKVTFKVRNVLVEADVPLDIYEGNRRGFIYLSDSDGKVISVAEWNPGNKVTLKAKGFTGDEFYLTEIIVYPVDTWKSRAITYAHIKPGTHWTLTEDYKEKQIIGYGDLKFINAELDEKGYPKLYEYLFEGYSYYFYSYVHRNPDMYSTPADMLAMKVIGGGGSVPTHYGFIPKIRAGVYTEVDLSVVNKPMTTRKVTIPGNKILAVYTYGLPTPGKFDRYFWVGGTRYSQDPWDGDTQTLIYANEFSAYYSHTRSFDDKNTEYISYKNGLYDTVLIKTNVSLVANNNNITGDITGQGDAVYINARLSYSLGIDWALLTKLDTNLDVIFPELPEVVQKLVGGKGDFSKADIRAGGLDILDIEGYDAFITKVQQSKRGFSEVTGFGNEWKYSQVILQLAPENEGREIGMRASTRSENR